MVLNDFETCSGCGALIRTAAKFCDQCGRVRATSQDPAATQRVRWYYNIWFVLFTLFFVAGPLGLPLVWKNPRFSRTVKTVLTLAMVVYTYFLIILTFKMFHAVMNQVNQFNSTLSPY